MLNGIFTMAASRFRQQIPELQIYFRNPYGVRSFVLPPSMQLLLYVVAFSAALWSAFATVYYITHNQTLRIRIAQYDALRSAYAGVSGEKLLLQQRLAALDSELEAVRGQLAGALARNQNAAGSAGPLEVAAAAIQPRPRPHVRPSQPQSANSNILPGELRANPLLKLPANFLPSMGTNSPAEMPLPRAVAKGAQGQAASVPAADASIAINTLEKLIRQTGLDADTMLRRRNNLQITDESNTARGGPFLTLPPATTQKFMRRDTTGNGLAPSPHMSRLEMLREALFSLPLAEPVDKYYISSGFGYRKDPFTHGRAFHSGADLVAPHGDPVRSSAPGAVIFAGRNGPYGNMVEIDHGNGVKSRYGHLSRITVVRGQKIGLRDLVGYVGNTGRSGTAHLHFEVWFDGKARNPLNFLKAGENVFQRQG